MAQIAIIDGRKQSIEQLTIVQMPYEYLPDDVRQVDITLEDIRIAIDYVALNLDLAEVLEFAVSLDTYDEARKFLEGYSLARLAARLREINYEEWLREADRELKLSYDER